MQILNPINSKPTQTPSLKTKPNSMQKNQANHNHTKHSIFFHQRINAALPIASSSLSSSSIGAGDDCETTMGLRRW